MRMLRVAAVVAAVGFGLVAVGCGPDTKDSGQPMDSNKMKEMYQKGQPTRPGGEPTTDKKVDDLAARVKVLESEVIDKLKPCEKAIAGLADKIKEAKGDANAMAPLLKVQMEANALLADVMTQLKGLTAVKDQAGFDSADKKLREVVDKLTTTLKDYMK